MSKSGNIIAGYSDGEATLHVEIKKPSARYFDEFLGMRCGADLHAMGLYPNAKELTESMGAHNAVRRILGPEVFGRRDVVCWCIGDGHGPRTGALLAFTSRWTVVSIDPLIKSYASWQGIQRLTMIPAKAEGYDFAADGGKLHVLIGVHSHAPWGDVWDRIPGCKVGIAIPCCFEHNCAGTPVADYHDWGIWSPKRRVMAWADEAALPLCKKRFE